MDYTDFIHSFNNKDKIYRDTLEVDEYYIKTVNNLMIDGFVLRTLRLLEGIDNKLRRDYIMKRVLELAPK